MAFLTNVSTFNKREAGYGKKREGRGITGS